MDDDDNTKAECYVASIAFLPTFIFLPGIGMDNDNKSEEN